MLWLDAAISALQNKKTYSTWIVTWYASRVSIDRHDQSWLKSSPASPAVRLICESHFLWNENAQHFLCLPLAVSFL